MAPGSKVHKFRGADQEASNRNQVVLEAGRAEGSGGNVGDPKANRVEGSSSVGAFQHFGDGVQSATWKVAADTKPHTDKVEQAEPDVDEVAVWQDQDQMRQDQMTAWQPQMME